MLEAKNLMKVLRALRPQLVAERAYADALEGMYEMQRKAGLLLYEALVGAGRMADAERLKRELKSRYPVPTIPQGDSEEDVVLRRLLQEELPSGDLDARLREAEDRAKGQGAATGK